MRPGVALGAEANVSTATPVLSASESVSSPELEQGLDAFGLRQESDDEEDEDDEVAKSDRDSEVE